MYKVKNLFKEFYEPQQSFVVRNPLFEVQRFFDWKAEETDIGLAKEVLRASLRKFYLNPIAIEALNVASPDLHDRLKLWIGDEIENDEKKEKTELALAKYMIRMCTRCTPYGLFATCTTGNFGESTRIELAPSDHVERHGRLDMDYVCQLHSFLLQQKEICDQLLFFPNSSLYRLGDQWRYIEHRFSKETGRTYHLVEIDSSVYLDKILQVCEAGKYPGELADAITCDDVSSCEASEFIAELIQNQVLVDELQPNVTGKEYFSILIDKLKTLPHAERFFEKLGKIEGLFNQLQQKGTIEKRSIYPQIARELEQLEIPLQAKTLIQVDSYRPTTASTLNKKVSDEVLKGLSILQLLTSDNHVNDSFADFKKRFIDRYEAEFIPLVEVLDTESGIGYRNMGTPEMDGSPLIDKLAIGNGFGGDLSSFTAIEDFKWQICQRALEENKREVVIDDSLIEQLSKKEFDQATVADSISVMVKLNAQSSQHVDDGNYTITLESPSGPSGANLLTRFCHLDSNIEKLTRAILFKEQELQQDCIFAEIVHLPESRVGNILARPLLRKYEIPYLCRPAVSKDFQISINDLLVGIENNRVVLRSKKFNKEVLPRLTNAHNFHNTTLPIYRFLCDLQFQGARQVSWEWGVLSNLSFLPRIRYDKFIFSRARWRLSKEDIKDCNTKDDSIVMERIHDLRKKKFLPAYVLLSQGDNELMLDLKNIFCVRILISEINKTGTMLLTETIDDPANCWIEGKDGRYTGEFIFSFCKKKCGSGEITSNEPNSNLQKENVKKIFPVGSEWLYAKIYCGTKTAEKILSDLLKPFTEKLLAERKINKYFFVRYHDTAHHIRMRFHSHEGDFWKEIICELQSILKPLTQNRLIGNLQFETYRREVERYGFGTMHLSEDIFWHHSEAILKFIALLQGDEGEHLRWQVGLKAIDLILEDFGYALDRKYNLIRSLNKSFADEFKIGVPERKRISEQFGSHKQLVQLLMSEAWRESPDLSTGIGVFASANKCYRKTIEEILTNCSGFNGKERVDRLLQSYLHMFMNRLFISNQRKVEFMMYEYLSKFYESKLAREKSLRISQQP